MVPGLDGEKMSKSYGNTISIFEEESSLRKKVMSLKTDSTPVEAAQASRAVDNSCSLQARRESRPTMRLMEDQFRAGGVGYGEFKKRLFAAVWEYFEPMRRRRDEILADPGYVELVLREGRLRANHIAEEVMSRVRAATGLQSIPMKRNRSLIIGDAETRSPGRHPALPKPSSRVSAIRFLLLLGGSFRGVVAGRFCRAQLVKNRDNARIDLVIASLKASR